MASRDLSSERQGDRLMLVTGAGVIAAFIAAGLALDYGVGAGIPPALHAVGVAWLGWFFAATVLVGRAQKLRDLDRLRTVNLGATVAVTLAACYLLGGATWIGPYALLLTVVGAAFTPGRARSFGAAGATIAGFALISSAQGAGIIPSFGPAVGMVEHDRAYFIGTAAFTTVSLAAFFLVSSVIAFFFTLQQELLARTTAELAQSKDEMERWNAELGVRVREQTRALEQSNRELAVMAEIGKIVNASLDIQQVYMEFLREADKLLGFDQASIAVYTPDRTRLRFLHAQRGDDGVLADHFNEVEAASSIQASREPQLIEDISAQPDFLEREALLRMGAVCGISVPIFSRGALLGSFNVASNTPGTFVDSHVRLMERMAEPLALALDNSRLYDEMRLMALSDGLTGLPNRRAILNHLHGELARCGRNATQCSVLVMDIDNFKVFNDSLGHQAGDELLTNFSRLLVRVCRDTDVVARQAGDEFTVLLPESGPEEAYGVAQRIHEALAAADWKYPGQDAVGVTTSIGVATYPQDADDDEQLLNTADTAMYRAKAAGGGSTALASETVDDAPGEGPRQIRFGVIETLANVVATRLAESGTRMHALATFTSRAAALIGQRLELEETEMRVLRIAALSHALGIYPPDDSLAQGDDGWGLDAELDPTYLKLGRLFVAASPGLDDAVHVVHYHHRPLEQLAGGATREFARILAVSEAYARLTMPGAEPQLSQEEAIGVLRRDAALDQAFVAYLAHALAPAGVERAA